MLLSIKYCGPNLQKYLKKDSAQICKLIEVFNTVNGVLILADTETDRQSMACVQLCAGACTTQKWRPMQISIVSCTSVFVSVSFLVSHSVSKP